MRTDIRPEPRPPRPRRGRPPPRRSRAWAGLPPGGRVSRDGEGYTARAAPAASAAGSAPPTRVVFLVAKPGKPRDCAAFLSSAGLPSTGGALDWSAGVAWEP